MDSLIDLQDSPPHGGASPTRTCYALHLLSNYYNHPAATVPKCPPPDLGSVSCSQCRSATTQQHFRRISQASSMYPCTFGNHDGLQEQTLKYIPHEGYPRATRTTALTPRPAPLHLPEPSSAMLLRDLVRIRSRSGQSLRYQPRREQVTAKFIVSEKLDSVSGVVEAVHRQLIHASTNCSVELKNTPAGPYLHITAPTKDDADALIETAQTQARDLVTNQPDTTNDLHVEPPSDIKNGFQIELHVNVMTGEARPYLKPQSDLIARSTYGEDMREYASRISLALLDALRKEGRFHSGLALRIHLGHYVLKRYPRGSHSYDYRQFETMVKNPRALGGFKTQIGDRTLAKATLAFIRESSSPFVPIDSQIPSAAHVVPDYVFEACSEDAKFEANLAVMNDSKRSDESSGDAVVYYQLSRARVYPRDAKTAELNITNISLGKNLDWKLEAVCEDQDERKFQSVHHYFQSAIIRMEGLHSDFDTYPQISLARHHALASYFKMVAIKSVYRFSWKATGYTIEIAINRRWNGIRELVDRRQPSTDFSLSIYGDSWDEDIRVANKETAGNIWGGDLQFLFRDEGNGEIIGLPDRVRIFLEMVRDVRDAFEGIGDHARPSP